MKNVPFFKSTSLGNNFVIVDETHTPILKEPEKSSFAYQATNINYGVGSDNFLILQSCRPEILRSIQTVRQYWDDLPDSRTADYIFRMFEPNGVEAFCCANGLLCIAQYLNLRYGVESAQVMTEIPNSKPKVVSIGTHQKSWTYWANLGHPRRISSNIADPTVTTPYDDVIDTLENINITFRAYDLAPFVQEHLLKISGYLVFTGEPHLIIFFDDGFSFKQLSDMIFISSDQNISKPAKIEKRIDFGTWLIHHIGTFVNKHYAYIFPAGININFVKVNKKTGALEMRCFERGINRETLSCGTGALAVSFVASRLKLVKTNRIILWPHRCRWNDPEAQILVEENREGWLYHGQPVMLFEGVFAFENSLKKQNNTMGFERPTSDRESHLHNQSFLTQFLRIYSQRKGPFGGISLIGSIGKIS